MKNFLLTLVLRAANVAVEVCLAAGVGLEQVAAVRAKDEGSDGGHDVKSRMGGVSSGDGGGVGNSNSFSDLRFNTYAGSPRRDVTSTSSPAGSTFRHRKENDLPSPNERQDSPCSTEDMEPNDRGPPGPSPQAGDMRIPTVHEALPFSPFSSIVPFDPGQSSFTYGTITSNNTLT